MAPVVLGLILYLCISYFLAVQFAEAASEKGYNSSKYLWISFLFGIAGWILVCALPDRGNCTAPIISDALPDL